MNLTQAHADVQNIGCPVFNEGDYAVLSDRKRRQYLFQLESTGRFESHIGNVCHDELIGNVEGSWVETSTGHWLVAFKPTMADFILKMPRIATVVYPKDLGAIIIQGDIFPGARVIEAGTGSGAATIALSRIVGPDGRIFSYDVRQDMINQAKENIESIRPGFSNITMKLSDVNSGFDEEDVDRVFLDLPEPWVIVPFAEAALVNGGILISFLPTILQVHKFSTALTEHGLFQNVETFEIMSRDWEVGVRSVRPSHRMIGHTGFITTARKCCVHPRTIKL